MLHDTVNELVRLVHDVLKLRFQFLADLVFHAIVFVLPGGVVSARKAEQLVKNLLKDGAALETIAQPEPEQIYLKDAAEQLKQILGTNVSIKQGRKKSRIEIEFYSESDLDRLIDLLLRKRQSSSPRVIDFNV